MEEVLVAIITALATLIGVAMPLAISAIQGNEKDKRDHQERIELERQRLRQERRKECAALLRAARDFGVKVQNSYEYHGTDKTERAWDIRQRAANITGQADEISLLINGLAAAADALAGEVNRLVGVVADPLSLVLGASTQPLPPDTGKLDRRIQEFKSAAQAALYGVPSPSDTSLVEGEFLGELTM
jgi:hypothetical protein